MFTETEIFLILLILCSIIVNVVLYFMWNIATKKFSELQKQYIDYLTKCSNDLKEKESILKPMIHACIIIKFFVRLLKNY